MSKLAKEISIISNFLHSYNVNIQNNPRGAGVAKLFAKIFPNEAIKINPTKSPWRPFKVKLLAEHIQAISGLTIKLNQEQISIINKQNKRVRPNKVNRVQEFMNSWEWKSLRYKVLMKYNRQCMCCGSTPPNVSIQVDHIKPISKFWDLRADESNLQVLCRDCNMGKSNKDQTDWRPHTI